MKILKLTNVYTYHYPPSYSYVLPSPPMAQGSASSGWFSGLIGSGGSQLQAQGQMQQHSMSQAQVVQKPPETTRREINIILENMTYFEELKGADCKTLIHLIGTQTVEVEETCDQIRKMIHGLEFNNKMDKLLE